MKGLFIFLTVVMTILTGCDNSLFTKSSTNIPVTENTGKYVINPQFYGAGDFSEGLAFIIDRQEIGFKFGFINKEGKIVVEPKYPSVRPFSEGLAAFYDGNWGYLDKDGKEIIKAQFGDAYSFKNNLAPVQIGDRQSGKWGYIDKAGKLVINPQFVDAYSFKEGVSRVRVGESDKPSNAKTGFIGR